jgi:glucokinase
MTDLILALDFGGTKLTAALCDRKALETTAPRWLAHKRIGSPAAPTRQSDLTNMIALARELLDGRTPTAVGVSFGGPVDFAAGRVILSHHVPGWEDTPLRHILAEEFGAPVQVDNDANAAALGEHHFGAGRGLSSLLYVTVSTGVGGGWILEGRPYRGHNSMAGEIGHTVADPDGPLCLCGQRGCVERLASGPYMAQDLAAALERAGLTGRDVAEMAAAGEETAVTILERGAWALGVGLGNAANLLNPERFILGGGVTKAGGRWWQIARQTARHTALPEALFDVVPAELGDDAPLWGAAVLAGKATR